MEVDDKLTMKARLIGILKRSKTTVLLLLRQLLSLSVDRHTYTHAYIHTYRFDNWSSPIVHICIVTFIPSMNSLFINGYALSRGWLKR